MVYKWDETLCNILANLRHFRHILFYEKNQIAQTSHIVTIM